MTPSQNNAAMHIHIAQWKDSRLSQAAYCKEHNIRPHLFSYYKKKFNSTNVAVKQVSQLVPVKLVDGIPNNLNLPGDFSAIKVTHANGFSLEILPNTAISFLKPVLELIRSVS